MLFFLYTAIVCFWILNCLHGCMMIIIFWKWQYNFYFSYQKETMNKIQQIETHQQSQDLQYFEVFEATSNNTAEISQLHVSYCLLSRLHYIKNSCNQEDIIFLIASETGDNKKIRSEGDVRVRNNNLWSGKVYAKSSAIFHCLGGGVYRSLPKDGGVEELHEDLTFGPRPKVWTRGQKWKNQCQRWCGREAQRWDNLEGGELDPAEGSTARRIFLPFYSA